MITVGIMNTSSSQSTTTNIMTRKQTSKMKESFKIFSSLNSNDNDENFRKTCKKQQNDAEMNTIIMPNNNNEDDEKNSSQQTTTNTVTMMNVITNNIQQQQQNNIRATQLIIQPSSSSMKFSITPLSNDNDDLNKETGFVDNNVEQQQQINCRRRRSLNSFSVVALSSSSPTITTTTTKTSTITSSSSFSCSLSTELTNNDYNNGDNNDQMSMTRKILNNNDDDDENDSIQMIKNNDDGDHMVDSDLNVIMEKTAHNSPNMNEENNKKSKNIDDLITSPILNKLSSRLNTDKMLSSTINLAGLNFDVDTEMKSESVSNESNDHPTKSAIVEDIIDNNKNCTQNSSVITSTLSSPKINNNNNNDQLKSNSTSSPYWLGGSARALAILKAASPNDSKLCSSEESSPNNSNQNLNSFNIRSTKKMPPPRLERTQSLQSSPSSSSSYSRGSALLKVLQNQLKSTLNTTNLAPKSTDPIFPSCNNNDSLEQQTPTKSTPSKSILKSPNESSATKKKKMVLFTEPVVSNEFYFDISSSTLSKSNNSINTNTKVSSKRKKLDLSQGIDDNTDNDSICKKSRTDCDEHNVDDHFNIRSIHNQPSSQENIVQTKLNDSNGEMIINEETNTVIESDSSTSNESIELVYSYMKDTNSMEKYPEETLINVQNEQHSTTNDESTDNSGWIQYVNSPITNSISEDDSKISSLKSNITIEDVSNEHSNNSSDVEVVPVIMEPEISTIEKQSSFLTQIQTELIELAEISIDTDDDDESEDSITTWVKPEQLKSNIELISIDDNNQQQKSDQVIETISLDDNPDNSNPQSSVLQQQQQLEEKTDKQMNDEIIIISDSSMDKSDNVSVVEETLPTQQQKPSDGSSACINDEFSQESTSSSSQYEPIDYSITSSPSKKSPSLHFLSRSMAMLRAVSNPLTIGTSPSKDKKDSKSSTITTAKVAGTQRASLMLNAAKENFSKSLGSINVTEHLSPAKANNNDDANNLAVVQPKKSILRTPSNENSPLTTKKKRVIFSEPVVSDELVFDRSSPILLSSISNAKKQPTIGDKRPISDLATFSIDSIIDDNNLPPKTADQDLEMDKTSNHSNIEIVDIDAASNSICNEQNINDNNSATPKRRKLQHQKATLEYNDDGGDYSLQQPNDYFQTMLNLSNSALKNGCSCSSAMRSNLNADWTIHDHENDDDDNDNEDNDYDEDDDFYFTSPKCITQLSNHHQSFEDKDSTSSNNNEKSEKITSTTTTLSVDKDDPEILSSATSNETNPDDNSNDIGDSNELTLLEPCAQNEFQPIQPQTTSSQEELDDMRKYIESFSDISPIKNVNNESSNNEIIMIDECSEDVNVKNDENSPKIENQNDDDDGEMVNIKIPLKLARKFADYLITYIKIHENEKKKAKLLSDDQQQQQR